MKRSHHGRPGAGLYAPLDFFQLRVPLLPIETYKRLGRDSGSCGVRNSYEEDLLASEPRIRCALAVVSPSLLDAIGRTRTSGRAAERVRSKLLRYLIRMSTRPTPYGLFAGVALGYWSDRTDLQMAVPHGRVRTRPDMGWLIRLVVKLESNPEVRGHLRWLANPAAFVRAGRVFLAERVSTGEASTPPAVSLRATGIVRRALLLARDPIPYDRLAADLLEHSPGATAEKIAKLITNLWKQTVLLTDLRPPLTVDRPAQYVVERLAGIPAATEVRAKLAALLEAAATADAAPSDSGAETYRSLASQAGTVQRVAGSPFQVDMALELRAHTISRAVGEEAARAAELLLRMGPLPQGSSLVAAYRNAFVRRYGADREVPVLELLDPNFGLGPLTAYASQSVSAAGIGQTKASERGQALMNLALTALRERSVEVNLDERTQKSLATTPMVFPANAPSSLDLYVSVGAASQTSLDAGDFELVVGPNVGAMSAGRNIGRFADLLGPRARAALAQAAACEEGCATETFWAELCYQPRELRSANVCIRPNVRRYEIGLGVGRGQGAVTIPLDELVVGVIDDRFCIRWPAADRRIIVTAGHMLNYLRAPAVCRFLAEASRDGCCQLSGFHWGPASQFPFLPRVRVGRTILAPAQWQITAATLATELPCDPSFYPRALDRWRSNWEVPRHVYLSSGDNRLLLDLDSAEQAEELRRSVDRLRDTGAVHLTEVLPTMERAWLKDVEGRHFASELVVSLALREGHAEAVADRAAGKGDRVSARNPRFAPIVDEIRLRLPGSDWLFVKLYVGRAFEDDLIAGSLRDFVVHALGAGMIDAWFFVRYSDPDPHIRLRFRGQPERLTKRLLPSIFDWGADLRRRELCRRLAVDTYDREVERYGGPEATSAAEQLFAADSDAVAEILNVLYSKALRLDRTFIAALSVDDLLASVGLDQTARLAWYKRYAPHRNDSGAQYRQQKKMLRCLLGDVTWLPRQPGGAAVAKAIAARRGRLAAVAKRLAELNSRDELTRSLPELCQSYVHLHLNRLLGTDSLAERRILGLSRRTREGLCRAPSQGTVVPAEVFEPTTQ